MDIRRDLRRDRQTDRQATTWHINFLCWELYKKQRVTGGTDLTYVSELYTRTRTHTHAVSYGVTDCFSKAIQLEDLSYRLSSGRSRERDFILFVYKTNRSLVYRCLNSGQWLFLLNYAIGASSSTHAFVEYLNARLCSNMRPMQTFDVWEKYEKLYNEDHMICDITNSNGNNWID